MMTIPWLKRAVTAVFSKRDPRPVVKLPEQKAKELHKLPEIPIGKARSRWSGSRSVHGAFKPCRYKIDPRPALRPREMRKLFGRRTSLSNLLPK